MVSFHKRHLLSFVNQQILVRLVLNSKVGKFICVTICTDWRASLAALKLKEAVMPIYIICKVIIKLHYSSSSLENIISKNINFKLNFERLLF